MTLDMNEGWKHPNTHKDAMASAIAKSIVGQPMCDLEQNQRHKGWVVETLQLVSSVKDCPQKQAKCPLWYP